MVKSIKKRNDEGAAVYAKEHSELSKVITTVNSSELALTQVILRFESMKDVGDAINHFTMASRIVKSVGQRIASLGPVLENATEDVGTILGETLAELGNLSPTLTLSVETGRIDELLGQAEIHAAHRVANTEPENFPHSDRISTQRVLSEARKVALLASGEEALFDSASDPETGLWRTGVEERVYRYLISNTGSGAIGDAPSVLDLSAEEFEEAVLRLAINGKPNPMMGAGR